MTDQPTLPPDHTGFDAAPDPLDELVSAVLDGEATPEEAARVAADPVLQARLARFRATADQVGTPVDGLSATAVDELIARAASEADPEDATSTADEASEGDNAAVGDGEVPHKAVTPLAAHRRRRSLPPTWMVAAAVVMLMVIGATLMFSSQDSGQKSSTSSLKADASSPQAAAPEAAGSAATGANKSAANTYSNGTRTMTIVYLGQYPTPEALRAALKVRDGATLSQEMSTNVTPAPSPGATPSAPLASTTSPTGTADGAPKGLGQNQFDRCDHFLRGTDKDLGAPEATATAYIGKDPVQVYVYPILSTPGSVRQYAVTASTCDVRLAINR